MTYTGMCRSIGYCMCNFRILIHLFKYKTANWSLRQGNEEVKKRINQKIYKFKQICPIFRFERQTFRGWKKGPASKERLSFKPKYWANLFKYIFFVFFFCLLLHRLAIRISLPIYIFYKLLLYWSWSTTGRSGTTQRFVAVELRIFHISSYLIHLLAKGLAYSEHCPHVYRVCR